MAIGQQLLQQLHVARGSSHVEGVGEIVGGSVIVARGDAVIIGRACRVSGDRQKEHAAESARTTHGGVRAGRGSPSKVVAALRRVPSHGLIANRNRRFTCPAARCNL